MVNQEVIKEVLRVLKFYDFSQSSDKFNSFYKIIQLTAKAEVFEDEDQYIDLISDINVNLLADRIRIKYQYLAALESGRLTKNIYETYIKYDEKSLIDELNKIVSRFCFPAEHTIIGIPDEYNPKVFLDIAKDELGGNMN